MRLAIPLLCLLLTLPASATTLVVGMEEANNKPFEYIDENTNLTGFHVELVRAVATRLGWQLRFKRYPWKRAMKGLESGELHAVTYVAQSAEREAFSRFHPDNLLHVSRTTLYIKRERAGEIHYQPPLEQMARRWRLGMPNGYYMSDELIALLDQGLPIERPTVTQAQLFIMLLSDRYDAIFGATSALTLAQAEIPGLEQQVQRLPGALLPGKRMYIAFSRRAAETLVDDFANAYRQFRQEPEYRALAERFEIGELLPEPEEFQ
jgi:polar amino acid transport system substrate-binding protein